MRSTSPFQIPYKPLSELAKPTLVPAREVAHIATHELARLIDAEKRLGDALRTIANATDRDAMENDAGQWMRAIARAAVGF